MCSSLQLLYSSFNFSFPRIYIKRTLIKESRYQDAGDDGRFSQKGSGVVVYMVRSIWVMARGRVSRIGSRPNPEEYTVHPCGLSTCVNLCLNGSGGVCSSSSSSSSCLCSNLNFSLRESRRRSERARGVGREITALTDWAPPIQFHKTSDYRYRYSNMSLFRFTTDDDDVVQGRPLA